MTEKPSRVSVRFFVAIRKIQDKVINQDLMMEAFNRTVKGLRAKTEVWAHSCAPQTPWSLVAGTGGSALWPTTAPTA